MASKLSVYNGALLACGERKTTLTEARKPRRLLDTVWDDGGVKFCLQQGLWNFSLNSVQLTYSPSVTPAFGYTYAFDKPVDWVRTAIVSDDPQFCNKRLDFEDQGPYWFAHPDTIYAKYVSSDATLGGDLSLWTPAFTEYVEHHFASKIVKALTGSNSDEETMLVKAARKLSKARVTDAMDESAQSMPSGSWARARRGPRSRGDGGSNSTLLG